MTVNSHHSEEHVFTFTAYKELVDTYPRLEDDVGFPILSQIANGIEYILYKLYNKKIWKVKRDFSHTLEKVPGMMITNIKIDGPADIVLELGGQGFTDIINITDISIPCVEYHTVRIYGSVPEEGDTITFKYTLKNMTEDITHFAINNRQVVRVISGMYGCNSY